MSCNRIAEHGSAFLDGELPTHEWVRFRLHLAMCPPCAEYMRQLGLTVDALRVLPGDEGHEMREKLMGLFHEWKASRAED